MCEKVYRDRLVAFEDVSQCYNFDEFLRSYRPAAADKYIKKQFAMDFEVRECGTGDRVFVRSKRAMGDKTMWNDWKQMYPSLLDRRTHQPHAPEVVPPTKDNKAWDEFYDKVVPTLSSFYEGRMRHGIPIPAAEREEMLRFLRARLPPGPPPAWKQWHPEDPDLTPDEDEGRDTPEESSEEEGDEYVPYLHLPENSGGRTCRCGSRTHLTTNSHACPLNPRNQHAESGCPVVTVTGNAGAAEAAATTAGTATTVPVNAGAAEAAATTASAAATTDGRSVRRRRNTSSGDANAAPPRRRRRRRTTNYLRANKEVEVLYDGKWWPGRIKFKHRGNNGFAIHYHDEAGCEEANVSTARIRPVSD